MKYYCIGIKGSGMSTLAQILHDLGNKVEGYDDAKETKYTQAGLMERNIPIYYDGSSILDEDTIVTYSAAFQENHKELARVRSLGLKIKSYNEILGELTSLFETIAVCGTHGKTTTSLLITNILKESIGCNYFVGDGSGYANKENKLFVIESCEYKKHFLAYHPTHVILTNIELEHTECYKDLEEIKETFEEFTNKKRGLAIICGDDENIKSLNITGQVITYGFNDSNNLVAKNVELTKTGSKFDVYKDGNLYGKYDTPLFGKHMILNSLAAIALCSNYPVSQEVIQRGLSTFKGAKRRFKESNHKDIVIIDDYAHHPTEIKVTLEAASQKYPEKELVAVFLPNTYSRTEALLEDFQSALNLADISYVMDIHCDRENALDFNNVSSDMIIKGLNNGHKLSLETIEVLLKHKSAVICFMSCTNIYIIEDKFKELLEKGE